MRRRDLLALLAAAPSPDDQSLPFRLTDIASAAGLTQPVIYGGATEKKYILETNGCGVAFYDYDHDGWPDILLLTGSRLEGDTSGATLRLYRNNRDGTFTDVTKRAGLERTVWASGVCIGDYDNDGRDDLFISCYGQNLLFHNNGDGTFTDVTQQAGLLHPEARWCAGATWIDYNRDGLLDLFVSTYLQFERTSVPMPGQSANCNWKGIPVNCGPKGLPTSRNFLYRNNGDGTFTDVSQQSGIARIANRYAMTAVSADLDDDGWPDIYVACDSTASIFYRNRGDGSFEDVALERGVAYNEDGREQAGMGVALGDTAGRGLLDIFVTHFADDTPILYRAAGKGLYEDFTNKAGFSALTRYVGWGALMADFDNDGWPDIFFVNGNVYPEVEAKLPEYPHRNPRVLLRNLGQGRFLDVSDRAGPGVTAPHSSRGCALGDFDNDGDVDILVMNMNEPPSLLRNDLAGGGNWLKVKLSGRKSNRTGLGARVYVTANGRRHRQDLLSQSSFYSQSDLRLHFGLGEAKAAELIEVVWPSGIMDRYKGARGGQVLEIKEGAGSGR
ncbi:MAG: CRTAC1 family protein [Acidobacteria bacterium]|nr:CRTAC1 family protein [Acidobacteriota bacterium]